jgi:hypothetical protein
MASGAVGSFEVMALESMGIIRATINRMAMISLVMRFSFGIGLHCATIHPSPESVNYNFS